MALNFDKYAKEGNAFISELARKLGYPEDKEKAGRVLKTILHAFRGQLTVDESLQFMAQLPFFLKAVYVMEWNIPATKKRIKHYDDFIGEIVRIHGATEAADFPNDLDIEQAIHLVVMQLRQYVSLGELEDLKANFPKELKAVFNTALMV